MAAFSSFAAACSSLKVTMAAHAVGSLGVDMGAGTVEAGGDSVIGTGKSQTL